MVARIKLAYIGGGSTRAPGTMASLIERGSNFVGSEVVLIDLDPERLRVVEKLAVAMVRWRDLDLRITATTDRWTGLQDCDAVLTSFRPGGFEARYLDESIPLRHGVIGQETQGPGGFFMALRSIAVMKDVVGDMEAVCPRARLFNYTNPINIVSQAVTAHTAMPIVSLCEGPIYFPRMVARAAGLDPDLVDAVMIGLNHGSWTVRHLYDGVDMIPMVRDAYERRRGDRTLDSHDRRLLHMAATMGALPADYFQYYYFRDEILGELREKKTTRAEDIMALAPGYWEHYRDVAGAAPPVLDPERSRGGIHELELAIDVMDAIYNDRGAVWPVNVSNRGSIPGFADDLVVEVPAFVDRHGATPLAQPALPAHLSGLIKMLAEYQIVAAHAGWEGNRLDAVRALATNPLVPSMTAAETLYDEMSAAQRDYLPARLLE